jgi:hypothetical protein
MTTKPSNRPRELPGGARAASLVLVVALAACSESAPAPAGGVQVRDSAGVRIVETTVPGEVKDHERDDRPDVWTVTDEATVVLGAEPGVPGGELHLVRGAGRFSGGGWAVANGGSREIFLYDLEGRHVRTVGGSGGGPGEFTNLEGIAILPGDTLLAWNRFPDRMTLFDRDGELIRTFALPPPGDRTRPTVLTARLENGAWLGHTQTSVDLAPGAVSHPLRLFRVAEPSDEPEILAQEGVHRGRLAALDGVIVNLQNPFRTSGAWAARGSRVVVGGGDGWELKVFGPDGGLQAIFRIGQPLRPVTAADRARAREHQLARFTGAARDALADEIERLDLPDTMAAWDEVRLDPAGRAWLRAYLPPWEAAQAAHRTWWILDADGAGLGTVAVTTDLARVFTVEEDGVLALRRDDLDVERVEFLPLVRTP